MHMLGWVHRWRADAHRPRCRRGRDMATCRNLVVYVLHVVGPSTQRTMNRRKRRKSPGANGALEVVVLHIYPYEAEDDTSPVLLLGNQFEALSCVHYVADSS
jgi:hypothetical protein